MKTYKLISAVGALLLLTATARADWNPGDPAKWVQHPDFSGWDVGGFTRSTRSGWTSSSIADDFLCTESGEITDIHLWTSWRDDLEDWGSIENIHLGIHSDNPSGPNGWSQPDQLLWEMDIQDLDYRLYGAGDQGWYNPQGGVVLSNNHQNIWQINIMDIQNPFVQEEGTIYWLDVRIDGPLGGTANLGWKTSRDHWNDVAVFNHSTVGWWVLHDPISEEPLDMAFVMVPEPNAIIMILVAGGGFVFVRRCFMI